MHRRLPHWQPDGVGYFVTWRLAGWLPVAAVADLWTTQGAAFVAGDRLLDAAPSGPRWLAEPEVAAVVVKVRREGAAEGRYDLGSWVLMPNHVHVWLKPGDTLPREIAWIKGRTAFAANRVMKRSGSSGRRTILTVGFGTEMSGKGHPVYRTKSGQGGAV